MKNALLLCFLLALTVGAHAQNGNSSVSSGSSGSGVKLKSTTKAAEKKTKHLKQETRQTQREHDQTENRIDVQNKARRKAARAKAASGK